MYNTLNRSGTMAKTFAVFSLICSLAAVISFFSGAFAYGAFCLVACAVGLVAGRIVEQIAMGNL